MSDQLELFEHSDEIKRLTKRKSKPKSSKLSQKEYDLLDFKRIINQSPPKKLLKKNPEYGNMFIPYHVVKQMLLAIFDTYEIKVPFAPIYVEGQIIYHADIILTHPVLKTKLTYSGTATVPLIPASGDFKWNHRNIPGGKTFAILNASKEIGLLFMAEADDMTNIMKPYFEKKQSEGLSPDDEARQNLKNRLTKKDVPFMKF